MKARLVGRFRAGRSKVVRRCRVRKAPFQGCGLHLGALVPFWSAAVLGRVRRGPFQGCRLRLAGGPPLQGRLTYDGPRHVRFRLAPLLWLTIVLCCPHEAAGQELDSPPAPTFTKEIAPLLFEACSSCHRPGGVAPFSLLTYPDVRQRATQIAEVTESRFMPPWKIGPSHDQFVGQRHLIDAEIALIRTWVDRGAPEGDARDLPPTPEWTDGWQLGQPDLIVTIPEPFTLQPTATDAFRIFAIPVPVGTKRYVRGVEFRPGNPRVVHHANIRLDRTGASGKLDAADPAPGYDGLMPRSAEYPDGHFLGWTPGQLAPLVGPDLAWPILPATDLVVQLHMQPTGATEQVQPSIGFYLSDEPPSRTPSILRLGSQGIDIPAGQAEYAIADSYVLPADADLLAIQPHAHYRARHVSGTAEWPDGTRTTLLEIDDWDFRWQHVYRYRAPLRLPRGTKLSMRFTYDNSVQNPRNPHQPPQHVLWGQRSADEMGDLWFQLLPRDPGHLSLFKLEAAQKMTAEDIVGYETMLRANPDDAELHDDVALLYLQSQQSTKAVEHFRASVALRPQSAAAHFNVATALIAAGRFGEAVVALQRALAIDPSYAKARGSLGDVFTATGRLDEAVVEYRKALQLDPLLPEPHNNIGAVLMAQGETSGAMGYFEHALRLRPDYAEAHYGLGRAYRASGDVGRALRHLREAARLKPDWSLPAAEITALLRR